ncbi:5,6-dimethylbenzimidazole synthase [Sphingomonas solaris]|uniref:5,6-dimethylbenzimidazole synthase n=1 Tax=Alterirhizorhabdus solaris TaxID=2529389 RepID=A0A558QT06_9SPHN|nr:5,6-dimethylbenzimidazole synthase [Sphingomonas solaris]TVV70276.1 5,6-dimethylbenzimidazole synthase [Sphingomonas solaris]
MSTPPLFDDAFRAQLATLFAWRRDVRHFRTDPLPDETVAALLETMALAPSVGNAQPWRIVRVRSPALREMLAAHVDAAVTVAGAAYDDARGPLYKGLKLHGLREAPLILAVFSDEAPSTGHGLGRATMPEALVYSTVMAVHTLWLAARAQGIGLGWVSILDPAAVAAMLDVPAQWALVGLLCLGLPADPAIEPELQRRGWQAREALHVVDR